MPSPWKKAKLGGISRLLVSSLRSKAKNGVGDSPLVVQAGFPTSVADFVVKNRSRLKKTPRWRRPPSPTRDGGNGGCSTMAVLASEIVAAAVGSGSNDGALLSSPRDPHPEMDEQRQHPPFAEKCREVGSVIEAETPKNESHLGLLGSEAPEVDGAQAVPIVPKKLLKVEGFGRVRQLKVTKDGVDQRIPTSKAEKNEAFPSCASSKAPETEPPESSPSAVARRGEACGAPSGPAGAERKVFGGGSSRGFMAVAKMAFIMFVLAVVSKKTAVAVSALAFVILFAESMGKRLIPLLGPCEEAKKSLGAIPGSVLISDLAQTLGGSASNIRGGIPILSFSIGEPGLGPSRPGRNRVAQAPANAAAPAVKTTSLASEEKGSLKIEGCRDDQESSIASRKNEEKKEKKKLFRNIMSNKLRGSKGVKGGKAEGKLESASLGQAPSHKGIQEEAMEEEEEEGKDDDDDEQGVPAMARDTVLGKPSKGSSEHLGFFVLILCGLIGGRVVALFLTVGVLCVSSARSLWEGWNSLSRLEALPDASTLDGLSSARKV